MSVNSSSPSNSSLDSGIIMCYHTTVNLLVIHALNITRNLLLVSLSTLVLYLGHQRWRQQRSFTMTNHSDIFTYHLAAMGLICCVGTVFYYIGYYAGPPVMMLMGGCLSTITYYGEGFFHLLTCVERYLAVVHPVTYLGLRKAGGVRIRNISIGCVWLMSTGWSSVIAVLNPDPNQTSSFIFFPVLFAVVVCAFCSLSVLRVLIRPGPGEVGGDRERVDQSKQRAFYTNMAITGVLGIWFVGLLVFMSIDSFLPQDNSLGCLIKLVATSSNVPSSLVLPLLYLHRAKKLSCCCFNGR